MSRQNSSSFNTIGNSRITQERSGWKSESTKSNAENEAGARRQSSDSTTSGVLTEPLSSRPDCATTVPSKMAAPEADAEAEAAALMSVFPDAAGTASTDSSAQASASDIPAAVPASAGKTDADMGASPTRSTPAATLATSLSTVGGSLGGTGSTVAPTPSTGAAIAPAKRLSVASILARGAGSSGEPAVTKMSLWKLKRGSIKKLARDSMAQAEAAVQAAENAANSDSDISSDDQSEQDHHGLNSRATSPGHFSRRQSEASLLEIDPHHDEDAQEAAKGIASLKRRASETSTPAAEETSMPTAAILKQARAQKNRSISAL